ncbi:MAG: membrane protein insertion efficiency factor YidD [Acidobacteria bacterium]|nr:membrane protein insertion efficiency factor YidD [Acidobacteriota bacterium]
MGCAAGQRNRIVKRIVIWVLAFYKRMVSPLLPASCRFYPSCSDYAREAVERHGVRRGVWLAVARLLRCQPLGGGGLDPVP